MVGAGKDMLELVGGAVILSIIGVTAYSGWSRQRANRRSLEGVCGRCGRANRTQKVSDGQRKVRMCDACAGATDRHHRAAYYFFLSTGTVATSVVAVALAMDLHAGRRWPAQALELLVPIVSPFIAAWWIQHAGRNAAD
jgi:hypothetical protein